MTRATSRAGGPSPARSGRWLVWLALFAAASPALCLRYLPMTDMPQHLAVASMLMHADDPAFGFADYYRPAEGALARTLPFATQYALLRAMARLVPLEGALRVFAFLCLLAYPLAIAGLLGALGRPRLLVLLALPLVYNRAFFWGFASFNLSVALAIGASALLLRPAWSARTALAAGALATACALTHVYGVALLGGVCALAVAIGRRREIARRLPALAPAALGALAWAWLGVGARGYGTGWVWPSLSARVAGFENALLGGYRDASEAIVLLGFAAVFLLCTHRSLPCTPARWRALGGPQRVLYAFCAVNLGLYLLLPQHTETAKFLHFRHAFLALAFLPALAGDPARAGRPARVALVALAVFAIANAWLHLARFDRESRAFDAVARATGPRPRIYAMVLEPDGQVMRSAPYLQYAAYLQAQRGGLVSETFPQAFWNLPLRLRDDVGIPRSRGALPWVPEADEIPAFFAYYDHLLVRSEPLAAAVLERTAGFRYELAYADPPWRLYRAPSR